MDLALFESQVTWTRAILVQWWVQKPDWRREQKIMYRQVYLSVCFFSVKERTEKWGQEKRFGVK